jgi:hypothetical protein
MIEQLFLSSVIKRFKEYKTLGEKTFAQLNDQDMHFSPNPESNSIAIIIQHMHGNMLSRWTNFLTEDGEKEWRNRDEEFHVHQLTKQQLIEKWEQGWKVVLETLESLTGADLSKTITIRSQPLNVVDAINRQMNHYSYHVGQVVYLGKWMKQSQWTSLTVPKDKSAEFNQQMFGSAHK